jgi:putative hydrolase of the HAD superfamily
MIKTIAFDADDTLWHNERIFLSAKKKYQDLLAGYHDREWIEQRLDEAESRNIQHFGYGIKGFTLSMIETACELTEGRISGSKIQEIIGFAREMLESPIEVLDGVHETIAELAPNYSLMVITKGDLFDQEAKLARSGIGVYFRRIEIVSKKVRSTYDDILERNAVDPAEFVMVGNSLRSDILPVLETGARAVYIPYETEWFHEMVSEEEVHGKDFTTLGSIAELSGWLNKVSNS